MKLYEYYINSGFNPCFFRLKTAAELETHFAKRCNLLANKLKLPPLLWKDRRVLEVGPGSGENALVQAKLGARLTLVEPIPDRFEEIRALFKHWKVEDRLEAAFVSDIESFSAREPFDAIIAEGFVHTLTRKRDAMRKLARLLAPGGVLVVSTADPVGIFLEYFKRFVVNRRCRLQGDATIEARVETARRFLGPDYAAIPSSRSFEAWARDNIFNPLARPDTFYGFDEILANLAGTDAFYYSSWPSYAHANDLKWHKHVLSPAAINTQALAGYRLRLSSFLLGEVKDERASLAELARDASGADPARPIRKALDELHRASSAGFADTRGVRTALARLTAASPAGTPARGVAAEMLALLDDPSPARYAKCRRLRRYWGCPGHHIVLRRPMPHEFPSRP